jgi:hypothetical protein
MGCSQHGCGTTRNWRSCLPSDGGSMTRFMIGRTRCLGRCWSRGGCGFYILVGTAFWKVRRRSAVASAHQGYQGVRHELKIAYKIRKPVEDVRSGATAG